LSEEDVSTDNASRVLIMTLIFCILPIRTLLFYCKKEVDEESNKPYIEMAMSFPSDYDKENPITMQ
jgi:hypothetical protein